MYSNNKRRMYPFAEEGITPSLSSSIEEKNQRTFFKINVSLPKSKVFSIRDRQNIGEKYMSKTTFKIDNDSRIWTWFKSKSNAFFFSHSNPNSLSFGTFK